VEHAESVVKEGHKKLGWKEADLAATRKGDSRKVKLALRLRAETTATIKWIAQRLQMGSWTHVNHLLYWHRKIEMIADGKYYKTRNRPLSAHLINVKV
jgi:hypothetical protein